MSFKVMEWSAWTPGLETQDAWRASTELLSPKAILKAPSNTAAALPSVRFLPVGMRKRLSPLCKVALYLINDVLSNSSLNNKTDVQVVMSSRHGESKTIIELLSALGREEPSSPMAFSRSVHNCATGLWSIAVGSKAPHTAISAMQHSFSAGLTEAALQLHANNSALVVYVYVEDELPKIFREFVQGPKQPFGGAFLLKHGAKDSNFELSCSSHREDGETQDFFRFLKNHILLEVN